MIILILIMLIIVVTFTIDTSDCDEYIEGPISIKPNQDIGHILLKDTIEISFDIMLNSNCNQPYCHILTIGDFYYPLIFIDGEKLLIQMQYGPIRYGYTAMDQNQNYYNWSVENIPILSNEDDDEWHTIYFKSSPDYPDFGILIVDNTTYNIFNGPIDHETSTNGLIGIYPYKTATIYAAHLWAYDAQGSPNGFIMDLCINSFEYNGDYFHSEDNNINVSSSDNCTKYIQGPFSLKENQNHGNIDLYNTTEISFEIKLDRKGCCCNYCHILAIGDRHPLMLLVYDSEKGFYEFTVEWTVSTETVWFALENSPGGSLLLDLEIWHTIYFKSSPRLMAFQVDDFNYLTTRNDSFVDTVITRNITTVWHDHNETWYAAENETHGSVIGKIRNLCINSFQEVHDKIPTMKPTQTPINGISVSPSLQAYDDTNKSDSNDDNASTAGSISGVLSATWEVIIGIIVIGLICICCALVIGLYWSKKIIIKSSQQNQEQTNQSENDGQTQEIESETNVPNNNESQIHLQQERQHLKMENDSEPKNIVAANDNDFDMDIQQDEEEVNGYKPINSRKDITDTDDTLSDVETVGGILSEKRKKELFQVYKTSKLKCYAKCETMGMSDTFIKELFAEFRK